MSTFPIKIDQQHHQQHFVVLGRVGLGYSVEQNQKENILKELDMSRNRVITNHLSAKLYGIITIIYVDLKNASF